MAVAPPALVVRLVSAVVPPTAPAKVVAPVVFTASVCAPLTVPLKAIAPLPLLASVVAPVSVTASLYVCVPLVVIAPVSCVEPPLPVARLRIPVKFAPFIVVVPLKFSVRSKPPPATVDAKVGVVPVSTALPVNVTASL